MADVEQERVTALWREAAAAVETPRCTCTEDESSDGSATYEDDPHCPIHGWCSWRSECRRLREQLDAATGARERLSEMLVIARKSLDLVGDGDWTPQDAALSMLVVAVEEAFRAALGVEGEQEKTQ